MKTLPPKGHLPCLCPRWDQLGTPTAMASPENSQRVKKLSFDSLCASSSHFVIICFSFSFCVSLSRLVSICFIVSQFVILSQFIISLFLFISNLSICARDSDARIEAGLVVSFHDVSSVHLHCILDLKESSFSRLFLLMKKTHLWQCR